MDSHCSLVPCSALAPAIHNGVLLTSRRQCTCIHLLVDQVIPGIPAEKMDEKTLWDIDDLGVTGSPNENGNPQLVSGAYLLGAPWKNSLMKLEPDMGRMRNTVATETQTRLPMDKQKVVTSVYYMFITIPKMVVNHFCHTHTPYAKQRWDIKHKNMGIIIIQSESTKHVGRVRLKIELIATCKNTRMQLVSGLASARYVKNDDKVCVCVCVSHIDNQFLYACGSYAP